MPDTDLKIVFENESTVSFSRDQWGSSRISAYSTLPQVPDTQMLAGSSQVLEYLQTHIGFLEDGEADVWCCWNNGAKRFGIRIHAPFQLHGIGSDPYYSWLYDDTPNSSQMNWQKVKHPPASITHFPEDIDLQIVAVPTVGSTNLSVVVTIKNL